MSDDALTIRDALLFDGLGSPAIAGATLVVENGIIVYAGAGAEAPPARGRVVDAEGRALIPGLIDCHVHLCFDGEPSFEAEARSTEDEAYRRAVGNAGRALAAGVTAVRDLGGVGMASLRFAAAQRAGEVPGPRVLAAGKVLTRTRGHAYFIGIECDTAAELAAGARALFEAGAGCLKIVATGGVLTPDSDAREAAYTTEEMAPAVADAHARGLRVAAHAIGEAGILAALRAGVDSIEHGCYLTDEAIGYFRNGRAALVPTLSAPTKILEGGDDVPAYAREKSTLVIEHHRASFRRAAEAGARVASGTDAGTPYNRHGGIATELRLMAENGLPLDRVLRAATGEAAVLLDLSDAGALVPGRRADAVLLEGDPLSSVEAFEKVSLVAQSGRIVRS